VGWGGDFGGGAGGCVSEQIKNQAKVIAVN